MFGGATAAQPAQTTGGLFGGATQTQPAQPGGLFGGSFGGSAAQQPQATGGQLFGGASANTGGMFGSRPAAASTGGGLLYVYVAF